MCSLRVHSLGTVEYEDGLELQQRFVEARKAELVPDTLMLLEHPAVLTLGRGAKAGNILAAPEVLRAAGVDVFPTDRGGDVTYHGPGQLVGYPILKLPVERQDVRRYVRDLEEVILRTLAAFGIEGHREPKWPGVWVRGSSGAAAKVAALGVHLSRWYTRHGFALNINTKLSHFDFIVPCGIQEAGVTSMQALLGRPVSLEDVSRVLVRHMADVFEATVEGPLPPSRRVVSVAVVRRGPRGRPEALLLLRHAEDGGFWQPVTGRVEPNETAEMAARRELAEETGASLPVHSLSYAHAFAFPNTAPPVTAREDAFAALWPEEGEEGEVRLSHEHAAYEWVDVDQALLRVPFVGLRRALRAAAALVGDR